MGNKIILFPFGLVEGQRWRESKESENQNQVNERQFVIRGMGSAV